MRQVGQFALDLGQREAQLLRNQDETDAANVGAQETPLVSRGAQRLQQPLLLVETQCRYRDAGTPTQFADGNEAVRDQIDILPKALDLKLG